MSTKIEWTTEVVNFFTGCTVESAGCTNCYAMRMAHRLAHNFCVPAYEGTTKLVNGKPVWTGRFNKAGPRAWDKINLTKPSYLFVNSMSDFFHPDIPDDWRDEAMRAMAGVPRHRYQILTKRPDVAARWYASRPWARNLRSVWIGASVERRKEVWRIDALRDVPAALRFLSVEPLIGATGPLDLRGVGWVITGGESGPGARVCEPEWTREVRDACLAQDVAYFHKQHGVYASHPWVREGGMSKMEAAQRDKHGKGGAILDGRLWRQMPEDLPIAA